MKKPAPAPGRQPFVAAHRGGPLSIEHHRLLIGWARTCAAHVVPLLRTGIDDRLGHALAVAESWERGEVATGVAMKAALGAHAAARAADDPVGTAVARAIGQAVATAHMADHSLGGAFYALKAVKAAGIDPAEERKWQEEQLRALPAGLIAIIKAAWRDKALDRRI